MNLREIFNSAGETLMRTGSPDAQLEAEVLIRHVLRIDRATFFRDLEQPVTDCDRERLDDLVNRRLNREPLNYITGLREFYGLDFEVSESVLIPRQETELLVDTVISLARSRPKCEMKICDIGTGSGAIAVSVAVNLPSAEVMAIDISQRALDIADANRRMHGVYNRVSLRRGNLLEPVDWKPEIIVSNPPYIKRSDLSLLQPEILYEPSVALDGGPDGLEVIRGLLRQSSDKVSSTGAILFEIDSSQKDSARMLSREYFPNSEISILDDLSGNSRAILIEKFNL
ncbi:peptide chain release factor N(5)-glutamine methyltransferase [SAR202 cluster bacterium AD-802-K11_MRT_200m]|nr:peptide chain release factor N(5)-glutamine methyltransferase [SAR202 cluster bacterium AD-802-K11_MRT_200m]